MILKIDWDMLAKAMGNSLWYFRLDDGTFCCGAAEDECPDSLLIPFPLISQTEIQRAYVQSLNDRTVTNRFRGLSDADYPTLFWKLFDDDGIKSDRYYAFEERYYLQAVIAWCRENGIAYRIT